MSGQGGKFGLPHFQGSCVVLDREAALFEAGQGGANHFRGRMPVVLDLLAVVNQGVVGTTAVCFQVLLRRTLGRGLMCKSHALPLEIGLSAGQGLFAAFEVRGGLLPRGVLVGLGGRQARRLVGQLPLALVETGGTLGQLFVPRGQPQPGRAHLVFEIGKAGVLLRLAAIELGLAVSQQPGQLPSLHAHAEASPRPRRARQIRQPGRWRG